MTTDLKIIFHFVYSIIRKISLAFNDLHYSNNILQSQFLNLKNLLVSFTLVENQNENLKKELQRCLNIIRHKIRLAKTTLIVSKYLRKLIDNVKKIELFYLNYVKIEQNNEQSTTNNCSDFTTRNFSKDVFNDNGINCSNYVKSIENESSTKCQKRNDVQLLITQYQLQGLKNQQIRDKIFNELNLRLPISYINNCKDKLTRKQQQQKKSKQVFLTIDQQRQLYYISETENDHSNQKELQIKFRKHYPDYKEKQVLFLKKQNKFKQFFMSSIFKTNLNGSESEHSLIDKQFNTLNNRKTKHAYYHVNQTYQNLGKNHQSYIEKPDCKQYQNCIQSSLSNEHDIQTNKNHPYNQNKNESNDSKFT